MTQSTNTAEYTYTVCHKCFSFHLPQKHLADPLTLSALRIPRHKPSCRAIDLYNSLPRDADGGTTISTKHRNRLKQTKTLQESSRHLRPAREWCSRFKCVTLSELLPFWVREIIYGITTTAKTTITTGGLKWESDMCFLYYVPYTYMHHVTGIWKKDGHPPQASGGGRSINTTSIEIVKRRMCAHSDNGRKSHKFFFR